MIRVVSGPERLLASLGPIIRSTEELAQRKSATRDYVVLAGARELVERVIGAKVPPCPGELAVATCPRAMAQRFLVLTRASDDVLADVESPIDGDDMVVLVLTREKVGITRLTRTAWAEMFPSAVLDGPVFAAFPREPEATN